MFSARYKKRGWAERELNRILNKYGGYTLVVVITAPAQARFYYDGSEYVVEHCDPIWAK